MIQEVFRLGPLSISPFGVMMAAAFFAALAQLRWGLKRLQAGTAEDATAVLLAAALGGILGAKLYYAALYRDWHLLFDRAGLVWYGGFILGALAVLWVGRRRQLDGWALADAAAPALALGYAVGRIGCFLVGDDFGMPTRLPWGVRFPRGVPAPTTAGLMRHEYGAIVPPEIPDSELIAVHPTQLYESLAAGAIWLVGIWMLRRGYRRGSTASVVVSLLAVERFLVEFVRAKDDRLLAGLTVAQILSLVVLLVTGLLWYRLTGAGKGSAPKKAKRRA
jgi:phosphatidylglycerol:prolipoprotein diacylglycerol transferase